MAIDPGWYPDPLGGQGARYWNGTQWDGAIQPGPPTAPQAYPELPAPTVDTPRSLWPIWVGLGLAVVIATASAAFVLTRSTVQAPEAAPTTPPITSAPKAPQADEVANEVQSSMQSKLDTDPDLSPLHLKVIHVDLVNKSGNEYKGMATVKTSAGTMHDVPIDVTADGAKTIWQAGPGAFLFALEDLPTSAPAAPPPPPSVSPPPMAAGPVENFRICPSGSSGVASDETSCAFADSVRASWYSQPGTTVVAYSPVTHQSYLMTCAAAVTNIWPGAKRCSGLNGEGTTLVVYIE
jgi:hypothetical protein